MEYFLQINIVSLLSINQDWTTIQHTRSLLTCVKTLNFAADVLKSSVMMRDEAKAWNLQSNNQHPFSHAGGETKGTWYSHPLVRDWFQVNLDFKVVFMTALKKSRLISKCASKPIFQLLTAKQDVFSWKHYAMSCRWHSIDILKRF